MPSLSIIPAAAVSDKRLTDATVRVLCAIGTFTNRRGGNVWASVGKLASTSGLTPRSVQRALSALVECGYLRRIDRIGRTSLHEIVLEHGETDVTGEGDSGDGGGVTEESPKRYSERIKLNERARRVLEAIWDVYPARETPHLYPPALRAVGEQLAAGAMESQLIRAAKEYRRVVDRDGTEKRYVKTMHRFFADEAWMILDRQTVYGQTREEWALSGRDVAEWDQLAAGGVYVDTGVNGGNDENGGTADAA